MRRDDRFDGSAQRCDRSAEMWDITGFADWVRRTTLTAFKLIGAPMVQTAGARLGPYEIVSALGAGGMGEVYRVLCLAKTHSADSDLDVRRTGRHAQACSKCLLCWPVRWAPR